MQLLSVPVLQESDALLSPLKQLSGDCIHATVSKAASWSSSKGLAADSVHEAGCGICVSVIAGNCCFAQQAPVFHLDAGILARLHNIVIYMKVISCFPKVICFFLNGGTFTLKVKLQSREIIVFISLHSWLVLFINIWDFCS